ncbi:hypothetical protein GGR51DRAFT_565716 [Nemania sp. FL0031]|nr:hypothetical protein GGR51DRAFT_565716 [Nemania sp. FL0031]
MDGSSSRFPSASVATTPNADAGPSSSITPRQSIRELFSSGTSAPTSGIDPPRPAKEGYEWVWFPGGYWAERQIAETPAKDLHRAFRWRKRSGKSNSESSKHSPRAGLTSSSLTDKTDEFMDHLGRRRSLTRTTESSESGGGGGGGGSFFASNRTPEGTHSNPYLTEEAHVQSLQWPSIDAATSSRSISSMTGRPMLKSRPVLVPSPLQFSSTKDEIGSDTTIPSAISRRDASGASSDTARTETVVPLSPKPKLKKQLINWRIISDNRLGLKRAQDPSGEQTEEPPLTPSESSSRPEGSTPSSSRKISSVSDRSHKSLKNLSRKLFSRGSKGPSSSKVSLSASIPESVPRHSPAPTLVSEKSLANILHTEYPGGEAMRIRTPPIIQNALDPYPRSFFSVLKPPSTPPASCTETHSSLEPRPLSAPSGSTPSSSSRLNIRPTEYYNDSGSSSQSALRAGATPGSTSTTRSRREPTRREWWEVPVPYGPVEKRAFKFDMPEHLPSSPMCPANKRHKSGGTGVCVYHGRAKGNRGASPVPVEGASREESDTDETRSDLWK